MEYYDDFDDLEGLPRIKNMADYRPSQLWRGPVKQKKKISLSEIIASLKEQKDDVGEYEFTMMHLVMSGSG